MSDRALLYATTFVRALTTGMVAVLLGVYLAQLDFSAAAIGTVVSAGLVGAAVAAAVATLAADRVGRRRVLVAVSLLTAAGGVAIALTSEFVAVTLAAFIGMVNGMGRDRGAAAVLEQAMLPATAADRDRTAAFAWYNVLQDGGLALGGLLAGLPGVLQSATGAAPLTSMRWSLLAYALLASIVARLYARLSPACEPGASANDPLTAGLGALSPASQRVLWRISSLFAVDAIAGGFLTTALLSYFFHERFGISAAGIGALFFAARVANAGSHLAAAWLAGRIGLLNTMVFTHVPSSLLLVTVAIAPSFPVAAFFFLLREALVEMDVPTRQSYVMAVVRPAERTLAAGITNLVRMGGWAVAPIVAGALMQGGSLAVPLYVGAAMKIAYDVLLYVAFRNVKPPEETS